MGERGTKTQLQAKCYKIIRILIAITTVWAPADTSEPKIFLRRATSDSLLIDVDYNLDNLTYKWEYKQYLLHSTEEKWEEVQDFHPVYHESKVAFYLSNLKKKTIYYIRLKVEPGGHISKELEARTCSSVFPPAVEYLREENSGPGWIDVRWNPPREECHSQLEYLVKYRADSQTFAEEMVFGPIDKSNPFADSRPRHPCPKYPEEFCVLLTDHVVAGKNHIIEVAVIRINTSYSQHSKLKHINVFVDPQKYGHEDPGTCEDTNYQKDSSDIGNTRQIVLPVWGAVTLGIGYIVVLCGTILVWFLVRRSKFEPSPRVEEYELPEYEELHVR